MYIVIPCKRLGNGKSRLSPCLGPQARRELCAQLLTHTLHCALGVVRPEHIRLVTSDNDAIRIANSHSVAHIADDGRGLNAALQSALTSLRETTLRRAVLVLPIDLPFATPEALMAAAARPGDIVIAADRSGSGTNLLLLSGAALQQFRYRFGAGSCAAHLQQARDRGFSVTELRDERLAFDLDEPEHYAAWRARQAQRNKAVA